MWSMLKSSNAKHLYIIILKSRYGKNQDMDIAR